MDVMKSEERVVGLDGIGVVGTEPRSHDFVSTQQIGHIRIVVSATGTGGAHLLGELVDFLS